jgi:hypothetical protein
MDEPSAAAIGGQRLVLTTLISAARDKNDKIDWILATLGRLPAQKVRNLLNGDPLLDRVAPLLLLSNTVNWLAQDSTDIDFKILLKQNL